MVAGRIAALGTPAELKARFSAASMDEVFVRLARPASGTSASGPSMSDTASNGTTASGDDGTAGRESGG
jgi:hypothetical protein